jgi:tetratricopeptide (TPR) repeat protein
MGKVVEFLHIKIIKDQELKKLIAPPLSYLPPKPCAQVHSGGTRLGWRCLVIFRSREMSKFLYGVLVTFVLTTPCFGQSASAIDLALELPFIDDVILDPRTIEMACSKVIANRKSETTEKVLLALKRRALARIRMKNNDGALEDADELCRLQPKQADFRALKIWVLLGLQRFDQAIDEAKEATQKHPKHPAFHQFLGQAPCARGEMEKGLDSINKAIVLDPKDPISYFVRGSYFFLQRDPTRALEDLDHCLKISPYAAQPPAAPYFTKGHCLEWH